MNNYLNYNILLAVLFKKFVSLQIIKLLSLKNLKLK